MFNLDDFFFTYILLLNIQELILRAHLIPFSLANKIILSLSSQERRQLPLLLREESNLIPFSLRNK
jgi:hypothetical protein